LGGGRVCEQLAGGVEGAGAGGGGLEGARCAGEGEEAGGLHVGSMVETVGIE